MTATMPDECVVTEREVTTSNDKPESAHIVADPDPRRDDSHAHVLEARINGTPVTALCGYTWVPYRSAAGLPVCQECKDIYEEDPMGYGDRDELPSE